VEIPAQSRSLTVNNHHINIDVQNACLAIGNSP
jgi:hypothetical protein